VLGRCAACARHVPALSFAAGIRPFGAERGSMPPESLLDLLPAPLAEDLAGERRLIRTEGR
jgi:hypothetical protein